MKHWDPTDCANAAPARLSPADRKRMDELRRRAAPSRRARMHLGSLVGLGLSLAFLAGLAWALHPVDPVARDLIK